MYAPPMLQLRGMELFGGNNHGKRGMIAAHKRRRTGVMRETHGLLLLIPLLVLAVRPDQCTLVPVVSVCVSLGPATL